MESKWYFFPGQTTENTKISDRAHALHVTKKTWGNITKHLDRKRLIAEALEKEKAHKKALHDGSKAMTKEWINSIENIRLRKEEERQNRIDQKKEDKIQMFYKMRAEQEEVRKELIDEIHKKIFRSTGYPKELTSALILSETLYERDKQKEFNQMLKKHEDEAKKQFAEEIIANADRERREDKEKMEKMREQEKKVAEIVKEQIKQNETLHKTQYRQHVERETQDRIKAAEEEELIKQYEHEEMTRKRREIQQEKKKELEEERLRLQIMKKEEQELEKATLFYSEAKKRIDCMLKLKEKEMRAEAIQKHEALAAKVGAIQESKEGAENERIAKAVAEREAAEKEKNEKKAAFKAKSIQDRIDDRKQYLDRLEKEKKVDQEMKRWEMLNRIKTAEIVQEYNEQSRRQKWAKVLEYRQDLLDQMAEENEIRKQEKEMDDRMSRVSFEESDKMFFDYANEVMELAKRKNRSTYPIEKVIMEYKKENGLVKRDRHQRCCKKH